MDGTKLQENFQSAIADLERLRGGWRPDADALAHAPTLSGWSPLPGPDRDCPSLTGKVSGHPTLGKSDFSMTSALLWISEDRTLARTLSRFYRLGLASAGVGEVPVCNERGIERIRVLIEADAANNPSP